MTDNNHTQEFDEKTLQEQLRARNVMKKEMWGFYALLVLAVIAFFTIGFKSIIGLFVFLLFLFIFRTATVWYQWLFLIRFKLTCPHCGKRLAERVHFFKGPNHYCPHCRQRALASVKQLVEYKDSASQSNTRQ